VRKRFIQSTWIVLVACTLLLVGCSDFDEMKSQRSLLQADALMQQGDELLAEQALADLVAKYPETQSGIVASKRLFQIQKQRELRERQAFAKVLDSYRQVLDGYHALYAEYPRSILALDQSDYFFDSAYLEEITPENYQAYLWLKSDGTDYRVWSVTQEKARGYAVEALSRKLIPFERDELVKKIKMRFQSTNWDGKLVALQEQN